MNNKFLYELQEDILDKKAIYILYAFVFILSFIINIENIKLYVNIFRFILSGIALVFLVLIYLKCKNSRNQKENRIIVQNIFFFIVLTFSCMYVFIKDLL